MPLKSLSQSLPLTMDEFDTNISMMYGEDQNNKAMGCVKTLLILFNLVCLATGTVLIYSGFSILALYSTHALFTQSQSGLGPTLLVLAGLLVVGIAFMGIVGVLKESVCMILSFSFILGVIFMFEISISLTGLVYQTEIRDMLSHSMSQATRDYATDPVSMHAVDTLQYQLSCCGVEGPSDWQSIPRNTTYKSTRDVVTTFESNSDVTTFKSHAIVASTNDVLSYKSTNDVIRSNNDVNSFKSNDIVANDVTSFKASNDVTSFKSNDVVASNSDVTSFKSTNDIVASKSDVRLYPDSCCQNWAGPICERTHSSGCLDKLDRMMKLSGRALGLAILAVGVVQFLGILFACSLGKLIRLQKTEREKLKWEFRNHLLQTRSPTNFETFVREGQMEHNKM